MWHSAGITVQDWGNWDVHFIDFLMKWLVRETEIKYLLVYHRGFVHK